MYPYLRQQQRRTFKNSYGMREIRPNSVVFFFNRKMHDWLLNDEIVDKWKACDVIRCGRSFQQQSIFMSYEKIPMPLAIAHRWRYPTSDERKLFLVCCCFPNSFFFANGQCGWSTLVHGISWETCTYFWVKRYRCPG